jgi:hypothetical protein
MDQQNTIGQKAELIFRALAGESVQATCVKCGATEFIIPLDEPIDESFFANYHCDECDCDD